MGRHTLIAVALLLGACHGLAHSDDQFERVKVYLERNVQDQDTEIKFEVTGGSAGLTSLKVVAPDGRTVIDFKSPSSKLGMRQLMFESPEPKNDGSVQADFPAGTYTFTGSSTTGARLEGTAKLSHLFPDPPALMRPQPDATNVPVNELQLSWQSIKGLRALVVVIVHEASGREIRANLPGTATRFTVPAGFLVSGTPYKLEIGAVAPDGNSSFIETTFTTARKQ